MVVDGPKIQDRQIVLGKKLRGFGTGLWNHSFAGKIEKGEDSPNAAARELKEESGLDVDPKDLQLIGKFTYEFTDTSVSHIIMKIDIYSTSKLLGEASKTSEMIPKRFKIEDVPYEKMWLDNRFWLPSLLQAKSWPPEEILHADFLYENLDVIQSYSIKHVPRLTNNGRQ